jgi:hypothetical protein
MAESVWVFGAQSLPAVNDEQRTARDGVEGLIRPLSKTGAGRNRAGQRPIPFHVAKRRENKIAQAATINHDKRTRRFHVFRLFTKLARCIENCTTNPTATKPHAM